MNRVLSINGYPHVHRFGQIYYFVPNVRVCNVQAYGWLQQNNRIEIVNNQHGGHKDNTIIQIFTSIPFTNYSLYVS
jgi:hypothetical protein